MQAVMLFRDTRLCADVSRTLSKSFDLVNSNAALHKDYLLFVLQSGELAENVSEIIDPHYADGVDMSEVQVLIT